MHNFTFNALYFYIRSTSVIYHKFYRNLASSNADNRMFCTVLLTSGVVMVQRLQPKGCELECMCVLVCVFVLPLFNLFRFIYY